MNAWKCTDLKKENRELKCALAIARERARITREKERELARLERVEDLLSIAQAEIRRLNNIVNESLALARELCKTLGIS